MEDHTNYNWDWSPLKAPRRDVGPKMWRIEWTMYKHRLQLETTKEVARLFAEVLATVDEHPTTCHCCIPRPPRSRPIDVFGAIGRFGLLDLHRYLQPRSHTNQPSSLAAHPCTPSNAGSSTPTSPSTNVQGAGSTTPTSQSTSQATTVPMTSVITLPSISPQKCARILFAVQSLRWSVELESITMTSVTGDSDFFWRLRFLHRAHRHVLIRWASPFRFKSCRCVKVCWNPGELLRCVWLVCLLVLTKPYFVIFNPNLVIAEAEQDLPDYHGHQDDYDYAPRPPAVKPPLIDPNIYQVLLSECYKTCLWTVLPWHDCIRLGLSSSYTSKIPKRKEDIDVMLQAGNGVAFGIKADYVLSLRILAAYHLLAIVPAFGFWAFWLSKHPDDWQNASVPLTTVLALTTVFWIMAGKRVGIS